MASAQLLAPLPLVTLEPGMTISVEAIDPSTGVAVGGVIVSNATVYVATDQPSELPARPVPLLVLDASAGGSAGT